MHWPGIPGRPTLPEDVTVPYWVLWPLSCKPWSGTTEVFRQQGTYGNHTMKWRVYLDRWGLGVERVFCAGHVWFQRPLPEDSKVSVRGLSLTLGSSDRCPMPLVWLSHCLFPSSPMEPPRRQRESCWMWSIRTSTFGLVSSSGKRAAPGVGQSPLSSPGACLSERESEGMLFSLPEAGGASSPWPSTVQTPNAECLVFRLKEPSRH